MAAGRRLFGECGVADAPLPTILRQADVSPDEFFARFEDKQALFRAVFERFEGDLAERVAAVSSYPDRALMDRLSHGLSEPTDVKRPAMGIPRGVLDIAFALGPDTREERTWEDLAEGCVRALRNAVLESIATGCITNRPAEPLARLLLAGINAAIAAAERDGEIVRHSAVMAMVWSTDLQSRFLQAPSRKERLLERLWDLAEMRFHETFAGSWQVRKGDTAAQVFAFTRDPQHALQTLLKAVPIPADVDLRCRAEAAQYTEAQLADICVRLVALSKRSDHTGAIIKGLRLDVPRNRVRVFVDASVQQASEVLSLHVDVGAVVISPQHGPPDA